MLKYNLSDDYEITFTSGQAESNSQMIMTTVSSYINETNKRPHVIVSYANHPSILQAVKWLFKYKIIEVSIIPYQDLIVDIGLLQKSIRKILV